MLCVLYLFLIWFINVLSQPIPNPLIKKYLINMIEVVNFDLLNSIKLSICVSVDTAKQIFLGTK